MHTLAINGGESVRTKAFPSNMPGASVLGEEELKEITDVIASQSPFRFYGVGEPQKVASLEKEICKSFGVKYSLAVSSGSAALLCAVAALGAGPGDEVIIPSFSWYSDYAALIPFGILPVFADIGEDLNLDPDALEQKITDRTRAVIVVHYQGAPAKMDRIMEISRKHHIKVVEDCAQAFGGSYQGKRLGTFGDIATASFQTHKVLTAGEGGLVYTDNEEYFVRAVRYHDLGFVRPYFAEQLDHPELAEKKNAFAGLQLRMCELQGACLLAQFRKLETVLSKCRNTHEQLRKYICEKYPQVKVRYTEGDCGIALILMMDNKEKAEFLTKAMRAEGIPCGPTSACNNLLKNEPIANRGLTNPLLPPFGPGCYGEHVRYDAAKDCLHTDRILERFVTIGIGPLFGEEEIRDIKEALDKVIPVL